MLSTKDKKKADGDNRRGQIIHGWKREIKPDETGKDRQTNNHI